MLTIGNTRFLRIIGALFSVISIIFIVKVMKGVAGQEQYFFTMGTGLQILLFLPVSCSMAFLMVFPWKWVLEFVLKRPISLQDIFLVYAESNIAKYWPGGFWQYLMRNFLGRNLNMTQWQIGISSLLEILCVVAGIAVIIFLSTLVGREWLHDLSDAPIERQWVRDFSRLAILIALLCVIFIKYLLGKSLVTQKMQFDYSEAGKLFLRITLAHLLYFILASVSFAYILRDSFGGAVELRDVWVISEVFIIAFFAGFIVPGAPSGLGIREIFLLFALSPCYGPGPVLMAAFWHRILLILGDVGIWVFSRFIFRLSKYVAPKI